MNPTTMIKRTIYRFLYVKQDVNDAIRLNDPQLVEKTLGVHIKDIFWKQYKKETMEK